MKYSERTLNASFWHFKLSIVAIFIASLGLNAQTQFGKKMPFKVISFGEKIDFGQLDKSVRWTVSGQNGTKSFSGSEINNYIFEQPGTYNIRFSENKMHNENECNHPPFDENFTVEVAAVKMVFDFSKIVFSKEIQSGISCDGIEVSVPVKIITSKEAPETATIPALRGAGIGVEITGKPVSETIKLRDGISTITYKLSGRASSPEYIMLDFFDINNQTQTYYLPKRLN